MDLESLVQRLFSWLPFFLILMILMGIAFFAVRTVLPRWQAFDQVSSQVSTQQVIVATDLAEQADTNNLPILNTQITSLQGRLNAAGTIFLTKGEAEQVLNRLYNYAYSRGVRVTNLQAQQTSQAQAPNATAPAYETSAYQLQVTGGVANLIDFISHFQEASLPSVNIASMTITRSGDQAIMTMGLLIYTSRYASGDALSQIPTSLPTLVPTNTRTPTPTPTDTPTPAETPVTQVAIVPTATFTITPSLTLTPTLSPTPSRTPTPAPTLVNCPGAPPSQFHEGDIAIVHFEGLGALRLLSDPNGSVMGTRTQAYNNDRLEIVTGPVCGNGALYWYVRNTTRDDALGWAAEAKGSDRWMCPVSNPTCS